MTVRHMQIANGPPVLYVDSVPNIPIRDSLWYVYNDYGMDGVPDCMGKGFELLMLAECMSHRLQNINRST